MRVLLTGASGFVGSHILDCLQSRAISTVVLLRPTSDRRFLERHLSALDIRTGAITEPASLPAALNGITHVIHCAGCTRARRNSDYYESNHLGTRNMVDAINARPGQVQRLVHVSSLAAAGPATPAAPAHESDPPHPVSEYGRSKLAGELEVRNNCRVPFTVLRPPAVYGPRDQAFLSMFKAVRHHLLPRPSATQLLSLVYVKDLAQAVVTCLDHPATAGKTYFVAGRETTTARRMAEVIAAQMQRWTLPCPTPTALLAPICLFGEALARLTDKPALLNLQKLAELRAPGWVCDPSRLERETGCVCKTTLSEGIAETINWYRQEDWL